MPQIAVEILHYEPVGHDSLAMVESFLGRLLGTPGTLRRYRDPMGDGAVYVFVPLDEPEAAVRAALTEWASGWMSEDDYASLEDYLHDLLAAPEADGHRDV